tara:strand:+ start:9971 stop:10666 length:696 start_codon:yes stop_codon:yes gene_type:complete
MKIGFLVDKKNYYIDFIKYIIITIPHDSLFFLFKDKDFFDFKNLNIIDNFDEVVETCDIIFSLGYWRVIKKDVIDKFNSKGGIINIHNSYLLKYEGRHTCTWTIQNNEKYHGVTIHYMTEKLDDGPIIDSQKVLIDEHDTSYTLMKKCNELALNLFKKNLNNIINKNCKISLIKDKNSINHSYKDIKQEISNEYINKEIELYNKIRSLTYPGKKLPYIILNNKKVFLKLED